MTRQSQAAQRSRVAKRQTTQRARQQFAPIFADLSARAYRVTQPRREIIARFARAARYVTARRLHAQLRAVGKRIGLATVYRTLEMLREVGAASRQAQGNGETAYLFCPPAHHHHAVCTKCGRVADVPCKSVAPFMRALSGALRFRPTQHRLEFFGTCARCS